MRNAPRSYWSSNSADGAVEAIITLRTIVVDRMPDVALFVAFAAVWAAVFFVVLSSKV